MVANARKTLELDSKIISRTVYFKNRYGIQLAGDLYLPNGYETKKNPAVKYVIPLLRENLK